MVESSKQKRCNSCVSGKIGAKEKGCEFVTSFSQPKPKTKNYEKTLEPVISACSFITDF
jgi:hypothetical protein